LGCGPVGKTQIQRAREGSRRAVLTLVDIARKNGGEKTAKRGGSHGGVRFCARQRWIGRSVGRC
jgi:hypothetical protein